MFQVSWIQQHSPSPLPIFKQNQINHKATTNTITIATIIITLRWSNLVVHKWNSYDLKRHTWQQRVSRPWTSKCDFWHSNTQQIAKRLSHLLPLLPLSPDNENISETWQKDFHFLKENNGVQISYRPLSHCCRIDHKYNLPHCD